MIWILTIPNDSSMERWYWMQTLCSFLEKDREKFLASLAKAQSPEKAQDAIVGELDRLLYQYNEQAESDRIKEAAAHMIQAARISASFVNSYGEVRVWERNAEDTPAAKNRSSRWFPVFLILGLGCFVATFILFQMAGFTLTIRDAVTPLTLLVLSLVFLFFAGLFLARRKTVKKEPKKELQTEVHIDPESVYQNLHTMVLVMDKNLEELQASEEWEARRATEESAETLMPQEQIDLYAGLLEAWYSKDGEVALDRIADVKYFLHRQGIDCVDFAPDTANYFDVMPSFREGTLRPALIRNGSVLKKGVASGGD